MKHKLTKKMVIDGVMAIISPEKKTNGRQPLAPDALKQTLDRAKARRTSGIKP